VGVMAVLAAWLACQLAFSSVEDNVLESDWDAYPQDKEYCLEILNESIRTLYSDAPLPLVNALSRSLLNSVPCDENVSKTMLQKVVRDTITQ